MCCTSLVAFLPRHKGLRVNVGYHQFGKGFKLTPRPIDTAGPCWLAIGLLC